MAEEDSSSPPALSASLSTRADDGACGLADTTTSCGCGVQVSCSRITYNATDMVLSADARLSASSRRHHQRQQRREQARHSWAVSAGVLWYPAVQDTTGYGPGSPGVRVSPGSSRQILPDPGEPWCPREPAGATGRRLVSWGDRGAQQDTLSAGTAVGTSSCPAQPPSTASLPVSYKTPLHSKLKQPLIALDRSLTGRRFQLTAEVQDGTAFCSYTTLMTV